MERVAALLQQQQHQRHLCRYSWLVEYGDDGGVKSSRAVVTAAL
jgi:hypothetical protein